MISSGGSVISDLPDPEPVLAPGRRVRVLLLLLLLGAVFYIWWNRPVPVRRNFLPANYAQVHTEQQSIVADIGREIVEMVGFAGTRKKPVGIQFLALRGVKRDEPPSARHSWPVYLVEAHLGDSPKPVRMNIVFENHLWAPGNFSALAGQMTREWYRGPISTRSAVDEGMFVRLTNPTPDALVREDKRLSEALTQSPLDAELHEEAALLIGSFALRHIASAFYDVRRELSRMTAHLAIARAQSEKVGPSGDLAEAIQNTLVGRQSAALEILQRLERSAGTSTGIPVEAEGIWGRALTLRNTGDYRKLDQPEQASLLERLEYARAVRSRVSSTAAAAFIMTFRAEKLAEWGEIILSDGFSVGEGRTWAGRAIRLEMDEISAAYRQYHPKGIEEKEWSAALNAPEEHVIRTDQGKVRLEVLGWGSWASLHQRQICQMIRASWNWLDNKLGAVREAELLKKEITKRFSELRLPLVEMESSGTAESRRALQAQARPLVEAHPELVPFALWPDFPWEPNKLGANGKPQQNALRGYLMKSSWFGQIMPWGTLYDYSAREENFEHPLPSQELVEVERRKAMAPYNALVLFRHLELAKNYRAKPEETEAEFAPISGYDIGAMQIVADKWKADPDRYERALLPVCRFDPDVFITLGDYLREHSRPEAAARAYQNAVDHAPDRIHVSNNVRWLVDYYYGQGRRKEAFEIAEMAAKVYSGTGLETMASLLERDNQLQEAEGYFRKIVERYDAPGDLLNFYDRHRRDHPEFNAAFERLMSQVFPQGLEPIDIVTLSGAPADGIELTELSETTRRAGLKHGDVIVAINGVRVRNSKQYFYLMDTAKSPKFEFGCWSGQGYRSINLDLPRHRMGGSMGDHARKPER